jgi:hypothetical protein
MEQLSTKFHPPPQPFSVSLHFDLGFLCCSHNVHPMFNFLETDACAHSCVLDRTSIIHKTLIVPLSCGENRTPLVWFIFSIKCLKCLHSFSDILYFIVSACLVKLSVKYRCKFPYDTALFFHGLILQNFFKKLIK